MNNRTHTVLGVFTRLVLRADLTGGEWTIRSAARATGTSANEAFAAALGLGVGLGARVWMVSDEWFSQTINLNPAQIAGLNEDQLTRALAFEAEPYSGIPLTSAALGFLRTGEGTFDVVAMPTETRDRLVVLAGEGFAGIAFASAPPDEDDGREAWLRNRVRALEEKEVATVGAQKPAPSPGRFRRAAVWMEFAALLVLAIVWWSIRSETRTLRAVHDEISAAAREHTGIRQQVQSGALDVEKLQEELKTASDTNARRLAVPLLLQGLAAQAMDEVVVRRIVSKGPSSSEITGVSLTSDAVDELGIAMKESLRAAGWMVYPGYKKAMKRLPNGGPWEFSISVVHAESAAEGVRFENEEELR